MLMEKSGKPKVSTLNFFPEFLIIKYISEIIYKLTSTGSGYGWTEFISLADLEKDETILSDDKLTIVCEVSKRAY